MNTPGVATVGARDSSPVAKPISPAAAAAAAWRAANYLCVAQLYLRDNVLLEQPLSSGHIKRRIVGHWGTAPGINFILAHLSLTARATGTGILPILGTGHAATSMLAWLYLEGTLGATYPELRWSADGLRRLVCSFGTGGLFRSELSAFIPGAFAANGELGPALAIAQGVALDRETPAVVCIVGDGELETGPAAAALLAAREIEPTHGRLPVVVVNLNEHRMGARSILGRMDDDAVRRYFEGFGLQPSFTGVEDHQAAHETFRTAFEGGGRARRPVVIVRSRKGETFPGPRGFEEIVGSTRAHKAPLKDPAEDPAELACLQTWLRSYRPDELFEPDGTPSDAVREALPPPPLRLGCQWRAIDPPQALRLPSTQPGDHCASPAVSPMDAVSAFLAAVLDSNDNGRQFRVFCPDELESNRLSALRRLHGGRVLEVLSEDVCHGWLEGYVRSGRHGILISYEGFASKFATAFAQSLKFAIESQAIAFRSPCPSLNYLLTSLGWHNVYTHQNPDFISAVLVRESDLARVYLPVTARGLVWRLREALASSGRINLVVASKYALGLDLEPRVEDALAERGVAVAREPASEPEIILASAGDVAGASVFRAADMLARLARPVAVRVVLVEEPARISPRSPRALPDAEYRALFGQRQPVLVNFGGFPDTARALFAGRPNGDRVVVAGYTDRTGSDHETNLRANGVSPEQICERAMELHRRQGRP